jgi:serine/threonine protein kinase
MSDIEPTVLVESEDENWFAEFTPAGRAYDSVYESNHSADTQGDRAADPESSVYESDDGEDGDFSKFLSSEEFQTWDIDPPEYPGLNHAASFFQSRETRAPECQGQRSYYDELGAHQQKYLLTMLGGKFAEARKADYFDVGKVVAERWRVATILVGVGGCFNRGIMLVNDEHDKLNHSKAIMKLLPTEAMSVGYARREVNVLTDLKHPNIIRLYDSYKPDHCHDTPWMVTEYCDKKSLRGLIGTHRSLNIMLPEKFVWKIFQSLVSAVNHCHQRPDPIAHRDITLDNIFLQTNGITHDDKDRYECDIKLGDFGCAVTLSEWTEKKLLVHDLPFVDPLYTPPEDALPTEGVDVFQIGLVMMCLYCLADAPEPVPWDIEDVTKDKQWPGDQHYHRNLRHLIEACLEYDPDKRPYASILADRLPRTLKALEARGVIAVGDVPIKVDPKTFASTRDYF